LEILFNWRLEGHGEISIKHRKENLKAGQALQLVEALMVVSEEREQVHLKREEAPEGAAGQLPVGGVGMQGVVGVYKKGNIPAIYV
jgi:hypothetical protein